MYFCSLIEHIPDLWMMIGTSHIIAKFKWLYNCNHVKKTFLLRIQHQLFDKLTHSVVFIYSYSFNAFNYTISIICSHKWGLGYLYKHSIIIAVYSYWLVIGWYTKFSLSRSRGKVVNSKGTTNLLFHSLAVIKNIVIPKKTKVTHKNTWLRVKFKITFLNEDLHTRLKRIVT